MVRYLIDEDLPRSLAGKLRTKGATAFDVRDVSLRGQPDSAVFDYASANDLVLVSGDLGFANLLRYPPGSHGGIVIARLPNALPAPEVVEVLVRALADVGDDAVGSLVIVEKDRIRIRRGRT